MFQTFVGNDQVLPVRSFEGLSAGPSLTAFFDLEKFKAAALAREPFNFVVVPHFLRPEVFEAVAAAFPKVPGPGSFPPEALEIHGAFGALLDVLKAADFQQAIGRKFEIDLTDRPMMLTIRGHAQRKDGALHTDTASKLISVLLYLNEDWPAEGGRLRLLRSRDMNDSIVEIPPDSGTLVAFRRSNVSWHGHRPYEGQRRAVQLNWMTDNGAAKRESGRHFVTAALKKIKSCIGKR